jgi:hypothetical protein
MYARALEDAEARIRELRHEEHRDLGLAALVLVLAVAVTAVHPALALPLLLGGYAVGILGLRALWQRWDLVERLSGDRDAYVISEVQRRAAREATIERRHAYAASIRCRLDEPSSPYGERARRVAGELVALAEDLDDDELELDPAAAVACARLLEDYSGSPLLNLALPPDELRSRLSQIRAGFRSSRPVS